MSNPIFCMNFLFMLFGKILDHPLIQLYLIDSFQHLFIHTLYLFS